MFDFIFDWRKEMDTHIEIIDFQHKQFFAIGREIEQLITTKCIGVTDEQLLKVVCELRDYVAYYFYEEERMMQQVDYPGLELHKAEHQEGVRKVQMIDFHRLRENPLVGLKAIKDDMQEWSFQHMLVSNIQMAKEIKDQLPKDSHKEEKRSKREEFTLVAVVDSIDSAVKAVEAGADRIELCSNLIIGGTTPPLTLYKEVRKQCETKIDVVIRPRSGDYLYNDTEFKLIIAEIKAFKEAGELGIKRVITSGQKANCLDGVDMIAKLMEAGGNKIKVIVNCGIDGNAIWKVYEHTGANAFRVLGMVERESHMVHRNMEIHTGIETFNEYINLEPDEKRIQDAVAILNKI